MYFCGVDYPNVQNLLNSQSIPVWLEVWAGEQKTLNFNIYFYFILLCGKEHFRKLQLFLNHLLLFLKILSLL